MNMSVQTYKVYFQNGYFVPYEPVSLPENTPVYIVVNDEPLDEEFDKIIAQGVHIGVQPQKLIDEKVAAIDKIFADIDAIKDEDNVLTDADWDELENLRSQNNLSRIIDL